MKLHKSNIIVLSITWAMILLFLPLNLRGNGNNTKEIDTAVESVAVVGKEVLSLSDGGRETKHLQKAIGIWRETIKVVEDDKILRLLAVYDAGYNVIAGEKDAARGIISDILADNEYESADMPDILRIQEWIAFDNDPDKNIKLQKYRLAIWDREANILPLSVSGMFRDSRGNQIPKIDPPPPAFPSGKVEETLSEIGKIYEEMGMTEEALNAFLESLHAYGSNLLWQSGERMKERSELWVKVAEINMVNNEPMLAARAYLKAAYCDGSLKETVVEGLNKCFTAQERTKEAKSPDIDIEKMKRIAQLYALINVHPRALEVLKKAEENTGVSMKDEKERILQEWIELMQRLEYLVKLSPDGVATVFGLRVSEIKDWEDVHIPYPTEIFWNNKPLEKMIDTIPEDGNNDNQDKKEKESLQELIKKPTGTQRGQMPSVNAEDDVKKAEKASSYFNAAWICATVGIIILCAAVGLAIIRRKKTSS